MWKRIETSAAWNTNFTSAWILFLALLGQMTSWCHRCGRPWTPLVKVFLNPDKVRSFLVLSLIHINCRPFSKWREVLAWPASLSRRCSSHFQSIPENFKPVLIQFHPVLNCSYTVRNSTVPIRQVLTQASPFLLRPHPVCFEFKVVFPLLPQWLLLDTIESTMHKRSQEPNKYILRN